MKVKSYSVKEASTILGFSTNSIYKFVDTGRLKASRGNSQKGRIHVTQKALEDFLGQELTPEYLDSILPSKPQIPTPAPPTLDLSPTPSPTPSSITRHPSSTPNLPLKYTRLLIILSLLFLLADIFISQNFSLLQQLIRLTLLAIIILLTYQTPSTQEVS